MSGGAIGLRINFTLPAFMTSSFIVGCFWLLAFAVWLFMMHFVLRWRPFKNINHRWASFLKKDPSTTGYTFHVILTYVLHALPIVLSLVWGIVNFVHLKNNVMGVTVISGPIALQLALLGYLNYSGNGCRLTSSSTSSMIAAIVLIFAGYIAAVVVDTPLDWQTCGYLFSWAGMLVHGVLLVVNRRRFKQESIQKMLANEDKSYNYKSFARDVSNRDLKEDDDSDDGDDGEDGIEQSDDDKWFTGKLRLPLFCYVIVMVISIVSGAVFVALFWNDSTDKFYASVGMASAWSVLDFIALIGHSKTDNVSVLFFIFFLAFVVKQAGVSMDTDHWFLAHGFYLVVFGSYFLTRAIWSLLVLVIMKMYRTKIEKSIGESSLPVNQHGTNGSVESNDNGVGQQAEFRHTNDDFQLAQSKIHEIASNMNHLTPWDASISFLCFILLIIALILEFSLIKFNSVSIDNFQKQVVVVCIVVTVCISLCLGAVIATHYSRCEPSFSTLLSYILGVAVLGVFLLIYDGLKDYDLIKIILFIAFAYIFGAVLFLGYIVGKKKFKLERLSDFVPLIAGACVVASAVCLVMVPIYKYDGNLTGLMLFLAITTLIFYIVSLSSFLVRVFFDIKIIILLLMVAALCIGFCVTLGLVIRSYGLPIVIFLAASALFLIIFALFWIRSLGWIVAVKPLSIILLVAFLDAAGCTYCFIRVEEYTFVYLLFGTVGYFVFFGSWTFYMVQKDGYKFTCKSLVTLLFLVVAVLFCIVYMFVNLRDIYKSVTSAFVSAFVISFVGSLGYLTMTSEYDVLSFSNLFLPVRRYTSGTIYTSHMFVAMFTTQFSLVWLWGMLTMVLSKKSRGSLGTSASFNITGYLIMYLLYSFDYLTVNSLSYMGAGLVRHSARSAFKAIGVFVDGSITEDRNGDQGNNVPNNRLSLPATSDFDMEDKIICESGRRLSMFLSALKSQIFISAYVDFAYRLSLIKYHLSDIISTTPFFNRSNFTYDERIKLHKMFDECFGELYRKEREIKKEEDMEERMRQSEFGRLMRMRLEKGPKREDEHADARDENGFIDMYFIPHGQAAAGDEALANEKKWERAATLFDGIEFYPDKPNPDTIKQGEIGDCYLISALAAISEDVDLVKKHVIYSKNTPGKVKVYFYAMGKWQAVDVDTLLPFVNRNNEMQCIHSRPRDQSIDKCWWFTMVERAYAKWYGSYHKIIGGTSVVALHQLTGFYTRYIDLEAKEVAEIKQNGSLWRDMVEWNKDGYMCCSSRPGSNDEETLNNIVKGHAYTILDLKEVDGFRILKIRNPWGAISNSTKKATMEGDKERIIAAKWKGNPKVMAKFKCKDEDDGVLLIDFDDMERDFKGIHVCLKHSGWGTRFIAGKLEPGPNNGARPVAGGTKDASVLDQYEISFKKKPKKPLRAVFERDDADIDVWMYLVPNKNGNKIKKLYQGDSYMPCHCPKNQRIVSHDFNIESIDVNYTVVIFRKEWDLTTNYFVQFWSDDVKFEIRKLPDEETAE